MEAQNRIFVGGIPVRVDKKTIVDFFSQYGKVKYCKIKKNSKTGRSLGYAYLTFEQAESLQQLVNRQIEFCGRICECKQVFRKTELRDELVKEKRKKLLVYDLDPLLSNNDLKEYFESLTSISHAYVVKDPENTLNKGYGYVVFLSEEDLEKFCSKKLTLKLGSKQLKYSNEFHLPPKKKKDGCLKTSSNNGESMRRTSKGRRKGSQKAQGEGKDSDEMSRSISMEGSEDDSNTPSSHHFSDLTAQNRKKVQFLGGKSSERFKNSPSNGDILILSATSPILHHQRPESSMETHNGKLLTDKGTGGTKSTRESQNMVLPLNGWTTDKNGRWVDLLNTSLRLDQRESNYKFNRPRFYRFRASLLDQHFRF